jgi:hypothetical protein
MIISIGLESTVERGRDIINTKMGFNIATLKNVQGISKNISFSMDKTKIQES